MPTYTTGTGKPTSSVNGAYEQIDPARPLPDVTLEYLANTKTEYRDNALFAAACQFRDASFSQAEAEVYLIPCCLRDSLGDEAHAKRKIKSTYSWAAREPIAEPTEQSASSSAPSPSAAATTAAPDSIKPEPLPPPIADGARRLIEHCFLEDERVSISEATLKKTDKPEPDGGKTKLRKQLLKELGNRSIEQIYPGKDGVFIRINPMEMRGKSDKDVTAFRFFLVEFDLDKNGSSIPKEVQFAIFKNSGFPIGAIVDSGNISLQAVIRVDAIDRKEFDGRGKSVIEYFAQFEGYDPSTKNPSRYWRLPGITRNLYKNRKLIGTGRQELLAINIGAKNWEEYEKAQQPTEEELKRATEERRKYYSRIERPMPTPMDKAAYHGITGQIVDIITGAGTEACPESLAVQFLVGFGNQVGRKPYRHQAAIHHLNEFVVLVGESGSGCKGTAWNAIYDLLAAIDPLWINQRVQDGLQSGEAIIDKLRDASTRLSRGGKPITDPGVTDKRLLIMEEEFARVLIVANRQGNTLSPTLRNAWDSKPVLWTGSKNDPQKATRAHVSLIGHIVPEELRKNLSAIDSENGFANRILWIAVNGIGEQPIPPAVAWRTQHRDLVIQLQEIAKNFQTRPASEIQWSPEAKLEWNRYYAAAKKRRFGRTCSVRF